MIAFLARYPWLLVAVVILGASFLAAYPIPVLALGAIWGACWYASTSHDKRHMTKLAMKRRAEYEDRLWVAGHPGGIYGQPYYPRWHR